MLENIRKIYHLFSIMAHDILTTVALKTAFSASRALIKLRCSIATKHDVNLQLSEWPI